MSANDCLPEKICYSCFEEIKRAYTFKLRCENSEIMLYRLLNQNYNKLQNKLNSINYHSNSDIPYLPPDISITIDTNENGQEIEYKVDEKPRNSMKNGKNNKSSENADDVVCLSDDEENDEEMECDDSGAVDKVSRQQNTSFEIEISDDEEGDTYKEDDEYMNGGYQVLDYASIKKITGNANDSYQAFLNPDSSNDYSSQYEISDAESNARECPKCTQLFESAGELKKHIREQHTRGFECNICRRGNT